MMTALTDFQRVSRYRPACHTYKTCRFETLSCLGRARICFTHGGRTHQTFIFHSKRIAEVKYPYPHLSGSVYVTSQSFPINFSSLTSSSTGPRVLFYRRAFASSIVFFVLHLLVLLPLATPVLTSKNLAHACGPPLFRSLTPPLRTYSLALNYCL